MKYFLTGSFIFIIILIIFFCYRQNIFSTTTLPYDDEQKGLEEQITIHFSHVVAENTPKGMAVDRFAQLVEEKSNGKMVVKIYPNGMLYTDQNEFQALLENDIQMIAPTFSKLTKSLPNWQVLDLPFLIENSSQLKRVMHSPLSNKLLDELSTLNIKGLTLWNNGFKQIASSTPIVQPEDFKGKLIRIMPSNILKQQYNHFGAQPVEISFGNVYYDVQNDAIDSQENTISNIYSKKFYLKENHITLSNHGIMLYAVLINEPFWESLDSKYQTIIQQSLAEMQNWQFELADDINRQNLQSLRQEEQVSIYQLDDRTKSEWKTTIQPIYDIYKNEVNQEYFKELLSELEKE